MKFIFPNTLISKIILVIFGIIMFIVFGENVMDVGEFLRVPFGEFCPNYLGWSFKLDHPWKYEMLIYSCFMGFLIFHLIPVLILSIILSFLEDWLLYYFK